MGSLLDLPRECFLKILSGLPLADIVSTASCCTGLQQLAADESFWGDLAEAHWGPRVRQLKPLASDKQVDDDHQQDSWQQYCYKRMSARTISRSPLNLLQESYPDPYQHIVCCVLCSRTSGSGVISAAVAAFFDALPTPSAVLEAPDDLLKDLLHPLGLQLVRMAAVRSVAHGFLATNWESPDEFHGCGKFVADSWKIFCRGWRDSRGVSDANLKAYLAWRNRQEHITVNSGDCDAPCSKAQRKQKQQQQKQQQTRKQLSKPRRSQEAQAAAPAPQTRAAVLKRTCVAVDSQASQAAADAAGGGVDQGPKAAGRTLRRGKQLQQQQLQQQQQRAHKMQRRQHQQHHRANAEQAV